TCAGGEWAEAGSARPRALPHHHRHPPPPPGAGVPAGVWQVPLAAESVDVAVFCLALMGTNLQEILEEANRVLKQGGTLMVAEVASRFEDTRAFVNAVAQLGFKSVSKVCPQMCPVLGSLAARDQPSLMVDGRSGAPRACRGCGAEV
uniref:Ribosomal RNA-processing protein 8 n=1 Tax=Buteo japonicus TaxID=224669 RepID=A0A8C0HMK5_9AVES